MIDRSDGLPVRFERPLLALLGFEVLPATHVKEGMRAVRGLRRRDMLLASGELGGFGSGPLWVLLLRGYHHGVLPLPSVYGLCLHLVCLYVS